MPSSTPPPSIRSRLPAVAALLVVASIAWRWAPTADGPDGIARGHRTLAPGHPTNAAATTATPRGHSAHRHSARGHVMIILSRPTTDPQSDRTIMGITGQLDRGIRHSVHVLPDTTGPALATAVDDLVERVRSESPSVVILSGEHAYRHLFVDRLSAGDVPCVFTGVGWPTRMDDFTRPGRTGMLVALPATTVLELVDRIDPSARRAAWIGIDDPDARARFDAARIAFRQAGRTLTASWVDTAATWREAVQSAHRDADVVLMDVPPTDGAWNAATAVAFVRAVHAVPSFALTPRAQDFAAITLLPNAQELGDWAGQVAASIIAGTDPERIPILPNQRWTIVPNDELAGRVPGRGLAELVQVGRSDP